LPLVVEERAHVGVRVLNVLLLQSGNGAAGEEKYRHRSKAARNHSGDYRVGQSFWSKFPGHRRSAALWFETMGS
jgi:hypothetical protein